MESHLLLIIMLTHQRHERLWRAICCSSLCSILIIQLRFLKIDYIILMTVFEFTNNLQGASSKQQTAVETATIEFFNSVISCHAKNQLTFSRVLCDIIQSQKNALPGKTVLIIRNLSIVLKFIYPNCAASVTRYDIVCVDVIALPRPSESSY